MKDNRVKVQVMLDLETINFIKDVARLAGTDQNTVVNVILATKLLQWEREDNDATKKSSDKSSDGKSPKKPRLAKRAKRRSTRSKRS
jgi:hypothetical protein